MHPWRLVAIVGAGFAALAMVFPFATLPVYGALDGVAADAWPALLPLIPVVVAAAVGDWRRGLRPLAGIVAVIAGCAAVLFAVVKLADVMMAVRDLEAASLGAGGIVLVAGCLIALTGTITSLARF